MRSLIGGILSAAKSKTPTTPVPYSTRGGLFSWLHRNDSVTHMETMSTVGTLFNIVSTTSQATADPEWKLWRKAKSGKREDRVEVTSHAALDVWNKPNSFTTRQELVEGGQQHIDLTGEGWLVASWAGNTPVELWLVRPDRMEPVPDPETFLAGYVYTGPSGEKVPLELRDVLSIRMPNPLDPYRGMGPVQSILTEVDSARYSAEWNRNFFLNSAEPGGIIEVPESLGDDEFLEMRERWNEQHKGVANAHRVAILERGKWVDRKFTQRDMQFVELRNVSKDVIRGAFGFPKFAAGEVEDVNRASAEASSVWFAKRLTVPRLNRWKGLLNNDFLPLFGATAKGLEFDYESPVSEDEEAENAERLNKAQAAKTYIDAGAKPKSVQKALELPDALEWEDKPEPPPQVVAAPVVPAQDAPPAETAPVLPEPKQPAPKPAEDVNALLTLLNRTRSRRDWGGRFTAPAEVRLSLRSAPTVFDVSAVTAREASHLAGRAVSVDLRGSELDVAREHAEGVLQALERFPRAPLASVYVYGPGGARQGDDSAYARTDGDLILFNAVFCGNLDRYEQALSRDHAAGWCVADTVREVALHEFGTLLAGFASADVAVQLAAKRAAGRGSVSAIVEAQVSRSAANGDTDLAAEAFTDVLGNGSGASSLSREVFAALELGYSVRARRGAPTNHPGHADQKSHGRKKGGSREAEKSAGGGSPEDLLNDEAAIRATFDYRDAGTGMSASVTSIKRSGNSAEVEIAITDRAGTVVGRSTRTIMPPGQREVHHDALKLDEDMQGQGFATRFNANAEKSYRAYGIKQITLTANMDVGGYAWARAGYNFHNSATRAETVDFVRELAGKWTGKYSPKEHAELMTEVKRVTGKKNVSPIELAMIGHKPGAATWPGKDLMMRSDWDGAKTL